MKNKNVLGTAGGLAVLLLVFIGCGEKSGEKEYGKAMAAWKSGELVKAQTLLEKAIKKTSGNENKSAAWNQLGLILWDLGKVEDAADAFNESCVLADTITSANLNLGIALFHAQRFDDAEMALNNVLGKDPLNHTALAMMGLIAAQKQDWTGASRAITASVKVNPQSAAGRTALALTELQRNSGNAIKQLESVLSAYPDYAPAAFNLAVIYEQTLGDKNEAVRWYNHYLGQAGENGSHVDAASQAIARLSAPRAATPSGSDPVAARRHYADGIKLLTAENFNAAIRSFEQSIQAAPNQKDAHYNMGYAYFKLGQYNEAANAYRGALQLDPQYADARYMLCYSYFKLRKWSDAEREANALAQIDKARGEQMLQHISDNRKR
ncbi:tetratricopeptide repeat protein [Pontiella sp.]|uniref:tetratricopeptide repeat protein n=2 Tax=Pontiella sp. TaxID=2837462 RepID=UPI00356867E0